MSLPCAERSAGGRQRFDCAVEAPPETKPPVFQGADPGQPRALGLKRGRVSRSVNGEVDAATSAFLKAAAVDAPLKGSEPNFFAFWNAPTLDFPKRGKISPCNLRSVGVCQGLPLPARPQPGSPLRPGGAFFKSFHRDLFLELKSWQSGGREEAATSSCERFPAGSQERDHRSVPSSFPDPPGCRDLLPLNAPSKVGPRFGLGAPAAVGRKRDGKGARASPAVVKAAPSIGGTHRASKAFLAWHEPSPLLSTEGP